MHLSDVPNLNPELRERLKVAITELSRSGVASGVHHNDGLRIWVHSNDYVELITRHVSQRTPNPTWVAAILVRAGLTLESDCDLGWSKDREKPGARYELAYEVGVATEEPETREHDSELVDGVFCYDYRPRYP